MDISFSSGSLDVSIQNWTSQSKEWTESSTSTIASTTHTVGDLQAGKYYNVTTDDSTTNISGCSIAGSNYVCQANQDGKISFVWNGGYSTHVFKVLEGDNSAPVISNSSPSGKQPSGLNSVVLSFTTDEDSTCKYSSAPGFDYDSMSNLFKTTDNKNHSLTIDASNGSEYKYYGRCQDSVGNKNNTDYVISFSIAPASGGSIVIPDIRIPSNGFQINLNDNKSITTK